MAPTTKANYRSYEAQARMVRAMVAAHPEVRWNYKAICQMYGSDMTEHACNHRFRPIKRGAKVVRNVVDKGKDARNVPLDAGSDEKDIAKYFGESTGDGMQFQFRAIKKDAQKMKQEADNGRNPASVLALGAASSSSFSTPTKSTPAKSTASSTGKSSHRSMIAGGSSAAAKKAKAKVDAKIAKIKLERPDTDNESDEENNLHAVVEAEDDELASEEESESAKDDNHNSEDETPTPTPTKAMRHDRVLHGRVGKAANAGAMRSSNRATAVTAAKAFTAQLEANGHNHVDLTALDGDESDVPTDQPANGHHTTMTMPAAQTNHTVLPLANDGVSHSQAGSYMSTIPGLTSTMFAFQQPTMQQSTFPTYQGYQTQASEGPVPRSSSDYRHPLPVLTSSFGNSGFSWGNSTPISDAYGSLYENQDDGEI